MLTKCPECELQVSDRAISCPHCGYPLQKPPKTKYNNSKKRRRLPNGFGQISEIKGRNLRKPFRAMVTVGKNEFGRPICKPLQPDSYFPTYNDAYAALVEYNRNPYELGESITMQELYEKWSEEYFRTLDDSSVKNHEVSWNYCKKIYNVRVIEFRPRHILDCMENGTIVNQKNGQTQSPGSKRKLNIKSLFNIMLDYAVEHGIVERNYAREFKTPRALQKETQTDVRSHIPFTDEEMNTLWANRSDMADIILIQCYSGWRPSELCDLRLENITQDFEYFTGGSKTEAGKDRIVPIHPAIQPLVKERYKIARENGSDYLINYENNKGKYVRLLYMKYKVEFCKLMDELNLNPEHRPHDCRKQFITMAKKYNVDEYAIKYIVGHAISDITEKVYTERDKEWLKTEMKKIKVSVGVACRNNVEVM